MRLCAVLLILAGCGATYQIPAAGDPAQLSYGSASAPTGRSAADLSRVAARVEPVAEEFCREEHPNAAARDCDFEILLDPDPTQPPNAYQTLRNGAPVLVVTSSLLKEMGSDDEIAFVLSHEAGHHIAAHLGKQKQQSMLGAMVAGGIVAAAGGYTGGVSDQALRDAMDLGSMLGGRAYSQTYELEADTLGAFISARSGYDAELGSDVFTRSALMGGGGLLSTHPGSSARRLVVSEAASEIRRQRAAGLVPRPGYAGGGF